MIIRRLQEEDKDSLIELGLEFYKQHGKELLAESENLSYIKIQDHDSFHKEIFKFFNKRKFIVFVVEDKDKLLGYIAGNTRIRGGRVFHKEGYVYEFFITEGFRNQGIGKKLFDSLIKEFKKRKCTHLAISAHVENKDALSIYRHLGFSDYSITLKKKL